MNRWVALVVVAASASALAACGVGAQHSAQLSDSDAVPFELLDPEAPALVPPADGEPVTVCLVGDGALRATVRRFPSAAALLAILRSLRAEVTEEEAANGLHSALTSDVAFSSAIVSRGAAVVDFAEAPELSGENRIVAVAQIVCTLLHQTGIGQVSFTVDGAPIQVPVGDGSLTSDPVTLDDYASLMT